MAFIDYLSADEVPERYRVPDSDNILQIHSVHAEIMQHHFDLYRELMHGASPLTRIQREIVAVAVSSINSCHY